MSDDLQQQLAAYDHAVILANQSHPGMDQGEQTFREIARGQLAEHKPTDRENPMCTGCPGQPWPCSTARGAIVIADPRYN